MTMAALFTFMGPAGRNSIVFKFNFQNVGVNSDQPRFESDVIGPAWAVRIYAFFAQKFADFFPGLANQFPVVDQIVCHLIPRLDIGLPFVFVKIPLRVVRHCGYQHKAYTSGVNTMVVIQVSRRLLRSSFIFLNTSWQRKNTGTARIRFMIITSNPICIK